MSFFTVVVLAAVLATVAPLVADISSRATDHKVRHFDSVLHWMAWRVVASQAAFFLMVLLAIYLAK